MFYIVLSLIVLSGFVFLSGLLVGRQRTKETSTQVPPSPAELNGVAAKVSAADGGNEITKDLQATRNILADLLRTLEDCEEKLSATTEGDLGGELHEISLSMQSAQEMLAVSYDHLRKAPVSGAMSVEGREQLHDWLERRLALLKRYGNSFSLGVVHFSCDAHSDADRGERVHNLTQIMRNFVRDTDRLFVYSDNEFVVGLPETLMEDACLFAVRCRHTMRCEFELDARLGITEAFADDNGRTLLKRADAALHHSLADPDEPSFLHDGHTLKPISQELLADRLMQC